MWTIHHPLSGLSLAQKRSCLKTHWTMRNMALVFHHIFCSPATHRPSYNNRQPSLVAMVARAGLPFYCRSYWFRVVYHHEIDDNNKEENVSSGNIIHVSWSPRCSRSALFCDITQRRKPIPCRRFVITFREMSADLINIAKDACNHTELLYCQIKLTSKEVPNTGLQSANCFSCTQLSCPLNLQKRHIS